MALTTDYRPQSWEEVIGNESIVQYFTKTPSTHIVPTIMFTGESGCGKTTFGRLFAQSLKEEGESIELNMADNRKIEDIRELIEDMQYQPMVAKYKVYILDEFHQVTPDAQTALLKPLEEPPPHVFFVLCTTDPQKVIKTIRTRAMEFKVSSLSIDQLKGLIKWVDGEEKWMVSDDVVEDIALNAEGCPRSALRLFEQWHYSEDVPDAEENIDWDLKLMQSIYGNSNWQDVALCLKNSATPPETLRLKILGYGGAILLKKGHLKIYQKMDCFREPLGHTGKTALILATYEAVKG